MYGSHVSRAIAHTALRRAYDMITHRKKLTPPQVARLWGVSVDKVLTWIRSGELIAINASTSGSGRPRYLVDISALEAFERRRQVVAQKRIPRRRRDLRRKIKQFF